MITCSVIGIIYFVVCFVRSLILMTTSVFPAWAIFIWIVISMIVPFITPFIVMSIDDKKISNESGNELIFFELDKNNHICNIQTNIQNWFDFTEVLNIKIDYKNWETYLWQ